MLNRRTPMKRTPFKRASTTTHESEQEREQRLIDKARRAMNSVVPRAANMGSATTAAAPIPKAAPVRSEALRRAVASLPCVICGMNGYSQAAHGSEGKGMGIKACDLTLFPACCDRPGVRGCHSLLDQGALFTKAVRREMEPVWAADTQRRLLAMGLVPLSLIESITTASQGATQ